MKWALPVEEVTVAVNQLAEREGCDPLLLLTTTLCAVIAGDTGQCHTVMRILNRYGIPLTWQKESTSGEAI
jgi:hypothetical protein